MWPLVMPYINATAVRIMLPGSSKLSNKKCIGYMSLPCGTVFCLCPFFCKLASTVSFSQLTIPCKDITAITKEKTARVIPNAIQITTTTERYFFTSFGARDKTYMMLFRIWQNALLDQVSIFLLIILWKITTVQKSHLGMDRACVWDNF